MGFSHRSECGKKKKKTKTFKKVHVYFFFDQLHLGMNYFNDRIFFAVYFLSTVVVIESLLGDMDVALVVVFVSDQIWPK